MRILLISKTYPMGAEASGTGAMAKVIAEGLVGWGHELQVLASYRVPSGTYDGVAVRSGLIMDQPSPSKMPADWTGWDKVLFIRKARHNYAAVRKAIQQYRPDVVYLNDIEMLTGAVFAACGDAGARAIFHVHDHIVYDIVARAAVVGRGPVPRQSAATPGGAQVPALQCQMVQGKLKGPAQSGKQRLIGRLTHDRPVERFFAAPLIAVSRFIAERYIGLGWPRERVHVVHNGLPGYFFQGGPRQRSQDRRFRLLFVGRCVEDKGVNLLPELMRRLVDRGVDAELALVGSFPGQAAQEAFMARVEKMGLSGRIQHRGVGAREELPAVYAEADCVVVPSLCNEAFGLMSAEAQACGTPVVAFRAGGLSETLVEGATGFLCERGDVEGMAGYVERLSREEGLWERMSEVGARFAGERFGSEEKVERIEGMLAEMVRLQ